MTNITIDDVMEYIVIRLSDNPFIGHELTNNELSLVLDIVRDARIENYNELKSCELLSDFWYLSQIQVNRKNLSRPKEIEMSDICELLNHTIKYQPERISKLSYKKRLKTNI
jgi:hypothetical protein